MGSLSRLFDILYVSTTFRSNLTSEELTSSLMRILPVSSSRVNGRKRTIQIFTSLNIGRNTSPKRFDQARTRGCHRPIELGNMSVCRQGDVWWLAY